MKGERKRKTWLALLADSLSVQEKELIASVIETADAQGDYVFDGEGSHYEDDVQMTLRHLAEEFRSL